MINSPSIANCDMLRIGQQIDELVKGNVKFLHIDLMDGHYVPNLLFPLNIVKAVKQAHPAIVADVHLMVTNPFDYVDTLAAYGADYFSFHLDSTSFSLRLIKLIQSKGMKAGVVINPSQRIDSIEPLAPYLDLVVLMTVEPGFAGQKFMDGSLERLAALNALRQANKAKFLISVDGGIDYPNSHASLELGADILITGIYTVFNQPDGLTEACLRFENAMNKDAKA
jgi:ribulose-phosphate 3-epimerase